MKFLAFGINHETASVATREAFAFSRQTQASLYCDADLSSEAEWMLLSTCNRTEVYLYGTEGDGRAIREHMAALANCPWPEAHTFALEDEDAVLHVLEVTSGLRSLVLGDAQIFCQVKEAYRWAVEAGALSTVMHRLLHTAFRSAKRVVTETSLTNGAASVPTAAVEAARRHFGSASPSRALSRQRVLIVGAGQMARLLISVLRSDEPAALSITNRSEARARQLAGTGAVVVPWESRYDAVADADVVLVASGAQEPILRAPDMPPGPVSGPSRLVVDIAVPRNVDPAVDSLVGYQVVDLDRLNHGVDGVEQQRHAAVPAAASICREELEEYLAWFCHHQALQPTIHGIRATFDTIRRQEIERHVHRFGEMDRTELDRLTESILQKLLAVPVVRLKTMDPESIDYEHAIKLLHTLFSREKCEGVDFGDAAVHAVTTSHEKTLHV